MDRALLPVMLLLLLGLSDCSNVKEVLSLDYTYNLPRQTFAYPPSLVKSGEAEVYAGHYTFNLDSILRINGLSTGMVGATYFARCRLTISKPDEATFSWLESSRILISDTSAFDSLQEIGSATDIAITSRILDYSMNKVNIRSYLGGEGMWFKIMAIPRIRGPQVQAEMYLDGQVVMHLQPLN